VKVGVTGGNGFIGGYVLEELLERGHKPLVFDHLARAPVVDVPVMLGDVRDEVSMMELAAHVDAVIHLAAVLGTQETIKNPRPAALSNMAGGLNFLEAIAQYDLPGVYICVGNHWMLNTYSITKTTVERFCEMFAIERGTRVNKVRVVNAYGPRQSVAPPFGPAKVRKITPAFACRALSGMPIEVYGDGEQVSDMVWVGDVAHALVSALEHAADGQVIPETIEVGPLEHATVNEVAKLVAVHASEVVNEPAVDIEHLPMRPGELAGAKVTADVDTLELIGMHHRELVPLEEGISRTVAWFGHNVGTHWSPPLRESA
jgi:nucleoside-diphosphate-sugar epimerase